MIQAFQPRSLFIRFCSPSLFFAHVFLKEKRDFWRDFGLLLRKGFANVRRDMTFLHLILEKIDLKINDRNFVRNLFSFPFIK